VLRLCCASRPISLLEILESHRCHQGQVQRILFALFESYRGHPSPSGGVRCMCGAAPSTRGSAIRSICPQPLEKSTPKKRPLTPIASDLGLGGGLCGCSAKIWWRSIQSDLWVLVGSVLVLVLALSSRDTWLASSHAVWLNSCGSCHVRHCRRPRRRRGPCLRRRTSQCWPIIGE